MFQLTSGVGFCC